MDKIKPFQKFLNTFETDEMRDYCKDMIQLQVDDLFIIPSSTSMKYHNKTQCQPGGHVYHVLMACEIMNYILGLDYVKNKYPKPKQRDCFRTAICLHDGVKVGWNGSKYTVHEHPVLAAEWIENTVVKHDIDPKLKKYCARLVASHSGQWTTSPRSSTVLPAPQTDEQFLIHLVDYLSSRSNLDMIYDEETKGIVESNLPAQTSDKWTFGFGKYKGMTFDEVLVGDKDYLIWLRDKSTMEIREPLKGFLESI